MATKEIRLAGFLPAPPRRIYDAWIDGKGHTAMTGSRATVESAEIGARFTAWNGYIEGTHVALEPGRRIFQSWRASDFPEDAPESYLEVRLEPAPGGTRITFRHTDLPAKQAAALLQGWKDYYLKPMARYFGKAAAPKAAGRKAGAGAAKRVPTKVMKKAPTKVGKKKAGKKAVVRAAGARAPARRRSKR